MKRNLVNGNFSSVPMAVLIAATAHLDPEDEMRDDGDLSDDGHLS